MKYLHAIIIIGINLFATAQTTIDFKNKESTLIDSIKKTNYKLPLLLKFPKKYSDTTVVFKDAKQTANFLAKGTFSKNISLLGDNDFYALKISDNGNLTGFNTNSNSITLPDTFYIYLGKKHFGPIRISKSESKVDTSKFLFGSIINDAQTINDLKNKIVNNGNRDYYNKIIANILTKYSLNESNISENHFLSNAISKTIYSEKSGEIQNSSGLSSAFSSIGGMDVTAIADGFAKFIVKRTKQELTLAFFDKFRENLENYPDIKTLFPQTEKLLVAIDDQIYDYNNYLNNLREAFREDLKTLDENLPGIIDNHEAFFKRKNNFELSLALRTGCYLSTSTRQAVHPGDLLNDFPTSWFSNMPKEDSLKLTDLKGALQTLQLFSESLKEGDTSKHTYWVNSKKIRQVINDKNTFKIYLGLLLQKCHNDYDNVKFGNAKSLYELLNQKNVVDEFENNHPIYKQYIITLSNQMNELEKMISNKEKPSSDSAKIELYATYMKRSIQFIQQCTKISTLPHMKEIPVFQKLDKTFDTYFDVAIETSNLAIAINQKNYSEAINQVIMIYDQIIKKPTLVEKNNEPFMKEMSSQNNDTTNAISSLAYIAKYGAMMANLVNAKTSDEVEAVIESAALPIGSARIKRLSYFNVALNAYVGPYFGTEKIQNLDNKFEANNFGLTAPIGISFGRGNIGRKNKGSISVLISILDLGTLTAFRFQNDTVSQIPTIQLKNIMSPGAFLSIGIPKCPLSINFGAQVGPNLRKINAPTSTTGVSYDYNNSVYWRLSASICVDLPLLNLYNKSEKNKKN